MKTRLLKRLRKKAKKEYWLEYDKRYNNSVYSSCYLIQKIDVYGNQITIDYDYTLEFALEKLNSRRRDFIWRKLAKMRNAKMKKQLAKY